MSEVVDSLAGPIFVAFGANLPSRLHGSPASTCLAALAALEGRDVRILRRSAFYESAPVPVSDQPWYVNGVAEVATALDPAALLTVLQEIEHEFGRKRRELNAARVLDLDIAAYGRLVRTDPPPILPHPRMADRAFVLLPLREIAPGWVHPVLGLSVEELVARLPAGQQIRRA
ncbi:MAG: 2-amino-4-hydroxy-6-hydroxymethyldihydropteridine diphosphokinase [Dongiaceae bacterium]